MPAEVLPTFTKLRCGVASGFPNRLSLMIAGYPVSKVLNIFVLHLLLGKHLTSAYLLVLVRQILEPSGFSVSLLATLCSFTRIDEGYFLHI